jgi:hypothetical protein
MDDFGGSHGELATGRRDWRLYLFAAFIAATISIVSTNARNAGGEGRFRSSEAVYRGRGSAREFFMTICLRKTEAMLLFSQSPDRGRGWLDDWPGEDREMSASDVWRTTPEASGEGSRLFYFFCCNPLKNPNYAK